MEEGKATVTASVVNLANTIIGAGVLTIPYAFRAAGYVSGIIVIFLVWFASSYSFNILARCTQATGETSYKGIAMVAYGRVAGTVAEALIMGYTIGNLIGRIIILGDFLPALAQVVAPDSACGAAPTSSPTMAPTTAPTNASLNFLDVAFASNTTTALPAGSEDAIYCQKWFLLVMVTSCILFPLSLLPRIEMLKFSSVFAVLCILYVLIVVVDEYGVNGKLADTEHWGDLVAFRPNFVAFMAFPILVVSFTAHYNMPKMYGELKDRTVENMQKVVTMSTVICALAYITMGMLGYLTFRDHTVDNILKVDFIHHQITQEKKILPMLAYAAMICSISLSYPLVAFAVRNTVMNIFFPHREFSWPFHTLLTFIIVGTSLGVGLSGVDLGFVFALMGSTVGVGFVYILPGLCYLRLVDLSDEKLSLVEPLLGGEDTENVSIDRHSRDRVDYDQKNFLVNRNSNHIHRAFPFLEPGKKTRLYGPYLLMTFGGLIGVLGVTAAILKQAGVIKL